VIGGYFLAVRGDELHPDLNKGDSLVSRALEEVVLLFAPMVCIHSKVWVVVVITSHHRNAGGHEGKQVRPTSNCVSTGPLIICYLEES
jgi:hypothetical protein